MVKAATTAPKTDAAPPPAPAPAPAPAATKPTAAPKPAKESEPIVHEWNDQGESSFADIALEEASAGGAPADAAAAPAPDPDIADAAAGTPAADDTAKPEDNTAAAKADTEPKTPAQQRRERLDAIRLERDKRDLEAELARTRAALHAKDAAEAGLTAKLAAAEARGTAIDPEKLTPAEREALIERLIIGAPAEGAGTAAAAPKPSPELEGLRKELDDLKAKDKQREQAVQDATVRQAIDQTAAIVKDADIPFVHAFGHQPIPAAAAKGRSAYHLTLDTAYHAWMKAGKAGNLADYVPEAGKLVNAWVEQQPEVVALAGALAKRNGAAAPAAPGATPAAKPAPAPSVGRRVAARTDASEELPLDEHERDLAIKRMYGWA